MKGPPRHANSPELNPSMQSPLTESQIAYREYLKTDHSRELRLEAFKKYGRHCAKCPATCRLDVHHLIYRHPWKLGVVGDLQILCRSCHEKEHGVTPHVAPIITRVEKQKIERESGRRRKKKKHGKWAGLSKQERRRRWKVMKWRDNPNVKWISVSPVHIRRKVAPMTKQEEHHTKTFHRFHEGDAHWVWVPKNCLSKYHRGAWIPKREDICDPTSAQG